VALCAIASAPAGAQEHRGAQEDARWTTIDRVFATKGEVEDGYYRINLPRTDLTVRIGDVTLAPGFELTSYVGFIPVGATRVRGVGEVVVRDDEVSAALAEAHRQGVHVTAVHNHLLGENPRIMYIHVMAEGAADSVAQHLRSVFARTATPLGRAGEEQPATGDWSATDAILGKHAEAEGPVAEYVFPRREHLTIRGASVRSTGVIESASEVVFQQLPGGRLACGGELFVLPSELDVVVRTLDEHGLHVTAVHNHMIDEQPRMYWIHWFASGDGPTLARGVAAALGHMNGAQKSVSE
jgi:hypothetical protein